MADLEPVSERGVGEHPRRRAAAAAFAGVATLVVLAASLLRTEPHDETRVGTPGVEAKRVLAVVGTQVLDISVSPPETVAELPTDTKAVSKAVLTNWGLIVATDYPGTAQLLRVPLDGSDLEVVAADPSGFAVDAEGGLLAWAVTNGDETETRLFEARLAHLDARTEATVADFAAVVGYAGRAVVLSTGKDPAGFNAPPERTSAAAWSPGGDVTMLSSEEGPYWSAVGTDLARSAAVLVEGGDGECSAIVELPSMRRRNEAKSCEGRPAVASFSPDGRWIAVTPGESSEPLRLQASDGAPVVTGPIAQGPAVWTSSTTFVVLDQGGSNAERCVVAPASESLDCDTMWTYVPARGELLDGPIVLVEDATTETPNREELPFAQPGPPPSTTAPPAVLVAVTRDGRLVVVDVATGRELRQLAARGDPSLTYDGEGLGPNVIDDVALSPDGSTVWFSECCEPAGGSLYRVPTDGSEPPALVTHGYSPVVATDGRYVLITSVLGIYVEDTLGSDDWSWEVQGAHGSHQELAWSLDGSKVAARSGLPDQPGQLALVESSSFGRPDGPGGAPPPPEDAGELVPGEVWMHPVFHRSGRLLAVAVTSDVWSARFIDADTGAPGPSVFDYGGPVLAQDYDPTGEWLLSVLADGDTGVGRVHWRSPKGEAFEVPGRYRTASW